MKKAVIVFVLLAGAGVAAYFIWRKYGRTQNEKIAAGEIMGPPAPDFIK